MNGSIPTQTLDGLTRRGLEDPRTITKNWWLHEFSANFMSAVTNFFANSPVAKTIGPGGSCPLRRSGPKRNLHVHVHLPLFFLTDVVGWWTVYFGEALAALTCGLC